MSKYLSLFIQHNLARRHAPSAAINRLLDELTPYSFLTRHVSYLDERSSSVAFPEIFVYIRNLANAGDFLLRIIPIVCVQEPNLCNGKPTGFPDKKVIMIKGQPRAAIVTLMRTCISMMEDASDRDCVWGIVSYKNLRLGVCSFYSDINVNHIKLSINKAKSVVKTCILMGDSNAHSTLWGNEVNNTRGDLWEQYIVRNSISLLNSSADPTFENHIGHSCIDLSLTNDPQGFSNWWNSGLQNGSDHSVILATSYIGIPTEAKLVQNIARTDWQLFSASLPPRYSYEICNTNDLERLALDFSGRVSSAFNIACPPIKPFPGRTCKWWTQELTNILRNKNIAARKARKYRGTPIGMCATKAKKALGKLFQNKLRQEKTASWKNFTTNLSGYKNISTLFKAMKHENSEPMPLFKKQNQTIATSLDQNLEILREAHFRNSVCSFNVNTGGDRISNTGLSPELSDFFNFNLIKRAIDSLPTNKAPGPDGIKNEIIKKLPDSYVEELLTICRASIAMGFIPSSWLKTEAIFIKKGGNRPKSEPKSYRPIGLSSTFLKLCERLINWRLKDTVLKLGIPKQHAFTLGLGTETAISEVTHYLEKAKLNGMKAIVLSIDIMGAFDSIPFDTIKQSLIDQGTEYELVCWLDYLSRNRVVVSKMGNSVIHFRPMEGTTQGGINGPDLWIICLWSIIFIRAARESKLAKFADDLISALMGRDLGVLRDIMQRCLDKFVSWFTQRGLTISAEKSFCMIVNKGRNTRMPRPLTINGVEVPFVDQFKYLGIIIDKDLSWKPHLQYRIKKAKTDLMVARKLVSNTWGLTPNRMSWL